MFLIQWLSVFPFKEYFCVEKFYIFITVIGLHLNILDYVKCLINIHNMAKYVPFNI